MGGSRAQYKASEAFVLIAIQSSMSTLKATFTFSPVARLLPDPAVWSIESHIITIAIATLGIVLGSSYILRTKKDGNVYDLGGIPIVTAWTFFTKRWDFLRCHFADTRGKMFRFRVMQVSLF